MILKNKTLNHDVPFPGILRVKPESEQEFLMWLIQPEDGLVHPDISEWKMDHEYEFIEE